MKESSKWDILKQFLLNRLSSPLSNPSFIFYFFIVIVLVGTTGVFYEIAHGIKSSTFNIEAILINISCTAITLIAASSVDIILISNDNEATDTSTENKNNQKNKDFDSRDIQTLGVATLVLGFILWLTTIYFVRSNSQLISWITSPLSLILSFLVWWIANADNKRIVRPNGNPPSLQDVSGDSQELTKKPSNIKS